MNLLLRFFTIRHSVAVLILFGISSQALAAPEIRNVNVRGLQIGGTTTVTIDGTDLLPAPRLIMSVPIAKQIVRPNGTAKRVTIDVTLDGQPTPGMYNLWLANANGISGKVVVAVDRLPHRPFVADLKALPVSLHGTLSGSSKLRTTFDAKKDQKIVFEVEAQRLGGKIRPVLHLYDPQLKHIAWSMPSPALRGDTRLQAKLPADGKYTLELHDLQYAAPAPNHFRLKIGSWQFADTVFPPAVQRGKQVSLELIGNGPPDKRISFVTSSLNLQLPAPWIDAVASSGIRPGLLVSDFPELIEAAKGDAFQQLRAIPSAISGRLSSPDEQDRFLLPVKPGNRLRFEVFADRIGSPIDAILELQNEKGGRLALNDDIAGTTDSRLDYTVPAKTEKIVIAIKDSSGRGGRRCIYRIAVTSLNATSTGDFQLTLAGDRHSVPAGGKQVVKVIAQRRGYNGPIKLSFDALPAGVQIQGGLIPAGESSTLLTLHGSGTGITQALTSFHGTSVGIDPPVTRFAVDRNHPVGRFQPWLDHEIAVALSKQSDIDFGIQWGRLPVDTKLVLGGKLIVPVRCSRPAGFDGPVRLSLVTSQVAPLNKGKPIPNRTLRRESAAAVEIPADPPAQKAFDAKLAAGKVLTDAQTNAKTVASAGVKANNAAAALVKDRTTKKTLADKTALAANNAAKTADTAKASAGKILTDALAAATNATTAAAKSVTAADAVVKQAAKKNAAATAASKPADEQALAAALAQANTAIAAAAKTTAAATTQIQQAIVKKSAALKTANEAAVKAKAAATIQVAANKALADAQTNAKSIAVTTKKANTTAAANTKTASDNLTAANKAAAAASATAKNETMFSALVPADLTKIGYELVFRAELLSRDKKTVLARSFTAVRQFSTLNPIVLTLESSPNFETRLAAKTPATVKLTGKIQRLAGMKGDVTVSLTGLPKGVAVPNSVVKAAQNEFALEVKFPAGFKPAQLNGIKLFATGKIDTKTPTVRSEEIAVTINLLPPEPVKK